MPHSDTGEVFTAPISTALRFVNFRLPFSSFRYATGGQGQSKLDPSRLARLSVRYRPSCTYLDSGACPAPVCCLQPSTDHLWLSRQCVQAVMVLCCRPVSTDGLQI